MPTVKLEKGRLSAKIRALYPDIDAGGIDLDVGYDDAQQAWMVHLKRRPREYKLYLEAADVESCLKDKKCVALGIEIARLGAVDKR